MQYKQERVIKTNYEAYLEYFKATYKIDLIPTIENWLNELGYSAELEPDDRFFDNFIMTNPHLASLRKLLPAKVFAAETKSLRSYISQLYFFSKEKQIFRFQPGITQKLIDTDIEKVDGYFLRAPAKSFYLYFPHNTEIKIHNPYSGSLLVSGVYVFMEDIKDTLTLDKVYTAEDNARIMKIFAIGGNPINFMKQINFFGTIVIKEGEDVFVTIKEHMTKYLLPGFEEILPSVESLYKFVCNAILYINSSNAEVNPVKAKYNTKPKTPKEIGADAPFSKLSFNSIGDSITIDRSYENSKDTSGRKHEISALHWLVRPHWRQQAYGKGRTERKLIWIERFEKGKDLGAEIHKKDFDVK